MKFLLRLIKPWAADKRLFNLFVVIIYAIIYDYVYEHFVNAQYSYSIKTTTSFLGLCDISYLLYILLVSFPFVLYRGINTIASAITLFVYIMAYIPIQYSILAYSFPASIQYPYLVVFFVCMCAFFLTDHIYMFKTPFLKKKSLVSMRFVEFLSVIMLFVLIILNRSQLRFVNFFTSQDLLYELREDNEISGVYFAFWMRSAFLPLLEIYYLLNHKYKKYFFTILGFFIVYMMDKQKFTIVFPFALTAMFYAVIKLQNLVNRYFHIVLILFLAGPSFVAVFMFNKSSDPVNDNPILFILLSMFVMRSMCICGMQLVRYLDFFIIQNHPFTYYGHVKIVNSILDIYPYSESIGRTVAGDGANSNATFWLMDGVAADGLMGCIIISVVFIFFKSFVNSMDLKINRYLCFCIILFGISTMLNVSLFTSINSSGILVLYFLCLLVNTKSLNILGKR